MLTILIASSKGGCGKSTLACGLAGYFACAGKRTALIDADPQRSASRWCERRGDLAAAVVAVDGCRRGWERRLPDDVQRLLIDTPAGTDTRQLAPWWALADAVLVPVLPSPMDLDASLPFLAALPASGKRGPALGLLGNRLRPWTANSQHALEQLRTWPYPLVGGLRDSQAYVLLSGLGRCLFDYHSQAVLNQQDDWAPLFEWLRQVNRRKHRG